MFGHLKRSFQPNQGTILFNFASAHYLFDKDYLLNQGVGRTIITSLAVDIIEISGGIYHDLVVQLGNTNITNPEELLDGSVAFQEVYSGDITSA